MAKYEKKSMKKIAFFMGDFTKHGGTQRVITTLTDAFVRHLNHKVYIISLVHSNDKPKYKVNENVELIEIGLEYKVINFIPIVKRINKIIKMNEIDVLLGIGAYLSILLPFVKCNKRIAYEHSPYSLPSVKVNFIRKKLYKYLEAIISLTEYDSKKYKLLNKSTYVIPNPIPFSGKESTGRRNVVCSIGTLSKLKGIDRLLEIWQEIEKLESDYKLEIYGDGPEKENLMKLKEKLELKNVKFMGLVDNIEKIYSESKILAVTSHYEGFSMVILEAMVHGMPSISYDVDSGPRELINDTHNGFLIENNNKNSYVKHLFNMMENEKLLKDLSVECYAQSKHYSTENIIEIWKMLL